MTAEGAQMAAEKQAKVSADGVPAAVSAGAVPAGLQNGATDVGPQQQPEKTRQRPDTGPFSVEYGYLSDNPPEDARHLSRFFFPSKFGGAPAWLVPEGTPEPRCQTCESAMRFLLQVHTCRAEECGPHAFHRQLYVFTCAKCPASFRCFRAVLPLDNPFYSSADPHADVEATLARVGGALDSEREELLLRLRAANAEGRPCAESSAGSAANAGSAGNALKGKESSAAPKAARGKKAGAAAARRAAQRVVAQQRGEGSAVPAAVAVSGDGEGTKTNGAGPLSAEDAERLLAEHFYAERELNAESEDEEDSEEEDSDSDDETGMLQDVLAEQEAKRKFKEFVGQNELTAEDLAYFTEWKEKHGPKADVEFRRFQRFCNDRPSCVLRFRARDGEEGHAGEGEGPEGPVADDKSEDEAVGAAVHSPGRAETRGGALPDPETAQKAKLGRAVVEEKGGADSDSVEGKERVEASQANQLALSYTAKTPLPSTIPACPNCGAARGFEFQVMPGLIVEGKTHHDFGSVCVYSCMRSCSAAGCSTAAFKAEKKKPGSTGGATAEGEASSQSSHYTEEFVFVQLEPVETVERE